MSEIAQREWAEREASLTDRAAYNRSCGIDRPPTYMPIEIDGVDETPHPVIPDNGERIGTRGAIIGLLPATTVPCHGETSSRGAHDADCLCGGTGVLAVPEDPEIDTLHPVDHSLVALEAAIDAHAARQDIPYDPKLGDTLSNLMRRAVANRTSSGSGRKAKAQAKSVVAANAEPPPSATDGRLERRGRKPRFDEVRHAKLRTSVEPETAQTIFEADDDLAHIAERLLSDPDIAAILVEIKSKEGAP